MRVEVRSPPQTPRGFDPATANRAAVEAGILQERLNAHLILSAAKEAELRRLKAQVTELRVVQERQRDRAAVGNASLMWRLQGPVSMLAEASVLDDTEDEAQGEGEADMFESEEVHASTIVPKNSSMYMC